MNSLQNMDSLKFVMIRTILMKDVKMMSFPNLKNSQSKKNKYYLYLYLYFFILFFLKGTIYNPKNE